MLAAAMAAGAVMALAMMGGSAGAATAPVTIGSTSGTPSETICPAGTACTYFSDSSGTTPAAQVPSDGTITSFSVNSGSAGNVVKLRVLRPAASGQFMGAGTGPAETLAAGMNTFSGLSIPVKAGDVLGIDNSDSAILFASSPGANTLGYIPALADGATAPTNGQMAGLLLLSAVEQPNSTTTTPTSPTTPITTTNPTSVPTPTSNTQPSLTSVSQAHKVWREGSKLASLAAATAKPKPPPVGTTLKFSLNTPAKVTLTFKHKVKVQTKTGKPSFVMKTAGQLSFTGHSGTDNVYFQGRLTSTKRLSPGNWTVVISASTTAGNTQVTRKFTIVSS